TLAPELDGAPAVIRELRRREIVVSMGHTAATYGEAMAAIEAGIACGTHLFNAMPPFHHREPGAAAALLTRDDVTVTLIADGVHVHPAAVAMAWRCKPPQTLALISDAIAALGMPPGTYPLGDTTLLWDGESPRLEDGTLAGSATPLPVAVRNLRAWTGCTIAEALMTVTAAPARLLGLPWGAPTVGAAAHLTVIDREMRVVATIVGGEPVFVQPRD
ncbi:MAG: N-acetylglucosamine-6-phosphate deacetylase, partial [Nitrospirae bacterium]